MTTRARAAGGVTKEQFEGRVRKWIKQWTPVPGDKRTGDSTLQLLKWVQTDERTETPSGPRRPDIRPVTDPKNKPVPPKPKPKAKRGFVVTLKRPAKAALNADDPTTTEATEGALAVDNEDDVSQPATSLATERHTSAGTPPPEGVSSEPDFANAEGATASSVPPPQILKLKLGRPGSSTPPLPSKPAEPSPGADLMDLD